jgi:hypothetical protein
MSKGIIHCYGKWEVLSLPSNHTVWYIQWFKKQTKDIERLSAIACPDDRGLLNISDVIEHIIGVEKQEPRGISQNYITFLK